MTVEGNTTRMIALLRRLKREMNGAVVGAMEERGLHYPLSYGVSLPTIRHIAEGYGTDHAFATFLFTQEIRELQLAGLFMADPMQLTEFDYKEWEVRFINAEIVEQSVSHLLSKSPCAATVAQHWMADAELPMLVQYAGALIASRLFQRRQIDAEGALALLSALFTVTERPMESTLVHGVTNALREAARYSATLRSHVEGVVQRLLNAADPSQREVAEEVSWQILQ